MKILQNAAKCAQCGDEIWSEHRHDYRSCRCEAIAVDGGLEYFRRTGDADTILDRSIYVAEEVIDDLRSAVAWAKDTGRNDLGTALAVIRVLQKYGVVDTVIVDKKI